MFVWGGRFLLSLAEPLESASAGNDEKILSAPHWMCGALELRIIALPYSTLISLTP
jgi:hypothetical protein